MHVFHKNMHIFCIFIITINLNGKITTGPKDIKRYDIISVKLNLKYIYIYIR